MCAMQRRSDNLCHEILLATLAAWRTLLEQRHAMKARSKANMAYVCNSSDQRDAMLSEACFKAWHGEAVRVQAEKRSQNACTSLRAVHTNRDAACAQKLAGHYDLLALSQTWGAWRLASRLSVQASCDATRRRQTAVSAVERSFAQSGQALVQTCLSEWFSAVGTSREQSQRKEANLRRATGAIAGDDRAALIDCFFAWVRAAGEAARDRLVARQRDAAAQRKLTSMGVVARQLATQNEAIVHAVVAAWSSSAHVARARRQKKTVDVTRLLRQIAGNERELLTQCFTSFALVAAKERSARMADDVQRRAQRHQSARQRAIEQLHRSIACSAGDGQRQTLLAWSAVSVEARHHRSLEVLSAELWAAGATARLHASYFAFARATSALKRHFFVSWRTCALASQVAAAVSNTASVLKAGCTDQRAKASHIMKGIADSVGMLRSLLQWRLSTAVHVQSIEDRRRSCRGISAGRAMALKLRGWVLEQRFLYLWVMMCPLKPVALLLPKPEYFVKEPPRFFVAPAPPVSSRPSSARPAPRRDLDRWGQLHDDGPLDLSPAASALQPGERFVLANRAMTSDVEYQKLLDLNKREIREARDGPDLPRFVGWGMWSS